MFHLFIVPRWVTQSAPVSGHSGSPWKKNYEASYEILVAAGIIKDLLSFVGNILLLFGTSFIALHPFILE
jgi:hypothetical protein